MAGFLRGTRGRVPKSVSVLVVCLVAVLVPIASVDYALAGAGDSRERVGPPGIADRDLEPTRDQDDAKQQEELAGPIRDDSKPGNDRGVGASECYTVDGDGVWVTRSFVGPEQQWNSEYANGYFLNGPSWNLFPDPQNPYDSPLLYVRQDGSFCGTVESDEGLTPAWNLGDADRCWEWDVPVWTWENGSVPGVAGSFANFFVSTEQPSWPATPNPAGSEFCSSESEKRNLSFVGADLYDAMTSVQADDADPPPIGGTGGTPDESPSWRCFEDFLLAQSLAPITLTVAQMDLWSQQQWNDLWEFCWLEPERTASLPAMNQRGRQNLASDVTGASWRRYWDPAVAATYDIDTRWKVPSQNWGIFANSGWDSDGDGLMECFEIWSHKEQGATVNVNAADGYSSWNPGFEAWFSLNCSEFADAQTVFNELDPVQSDFDACVYLALGGAGPWSAWAMPQATLVLTDQAAFWEQLGLVVDRMVDPTNGHSSFYQPAAVVNRMLVSAPESAVAAPLWTGISEAGAAEFLGAMFDSSNYESSNVADYRYVYGSDDWSFLQQLCGVVSATATHFEAYNSVYNLTINSGFAHCADLRDVLGMTVADDPIAQSVVSTSNAISTFADERARATNWVGAQANIEQAFDLLVPLIESLPDATVAATKAVLEQRRATNGLPDAGVAAADVYELDTAIAGLAPFQMFMVESATDAMGRYPDVWHTHALNQLCAIAKNSPLTNPLLDVQQAIIDCAWSKPDADVAAEAIAAINFNDSTAANTAAANAAIDTFWSRYKDDTTLHDIELWATGPDGFTYNVLEDLKDDWLQVVADPNPVAQAGLDSLNTLIESLTAYAFLQGSAPPVTYETLGDFFDSYIADPDVGPADKIMRLADLCRAVEAFHDQVLAFYATTVFVPVANPATPTGLIAELGACTDFSDQTGLSLNLTREHVSLLQNNGAYRAQAWADYRAQLEGLVRTVSVEARLGYGTLSSGDQAVDVVAAINDHLQLVPDQNFTNAVQDQLDLITGQAGLRQLLTRSPNRTTTLIINKMCEMASFVDSTYQQIAGSGDRLGECSYDEQVDDARMNYHEATVYSIGDAADELWDVVIDDIVEYAAFIADQKDNLADLYRGAEMYWHYLDANYYQVGDPKEALRLGLFDKPNRLAAYLQLLGDSIVDLPKLADDLPTKPATLPDQLKLTGVICTAINAVVTADYRAGEVIRDGIDHVAARDAASETTAGLAAPFDWSTTCVASGEHETTPDKACVRRIDLYSADFTLASYTCEGFVTNYDPATHHIVVKVSDTAALTVPEIQSEIGFDATSAGCSAIANTNAEKLIDLHADGDIEVLSYDGIVPRTVSDAKVRRWITAVQRNHVSDLTGNGIADVTAFSGTVQTRSGPLEIPAEHNYLVFEAGQPNVTTAVMRVPHAVDTFPQPLGRTELGRPIAADLQNQGRPLGMTVTVRRTASPGLTWSWNTDDLIAVLYHELIHTAQKYELADLVAAVRSEPLTRLGLTLSLTTSINQEKVPTQFELRFRSEPALSRISSMMEAAQQASCGALDCFGPWMQPSWMEWHLMDYKGMYSEQVTTSQAELSDLYRVFEADWS